MAWDKSVPTSATSIASIPSIFQANWTVCENIQGVQHYTYTSSLSGRHKPGITPFLYANSTTNINNLTAMQSGAIAYDTTIGLLKRYDGSAWVQVNLDPMGHALVYRNGDQTITSAAADDVYTAIQYNTESADPLSAFNTSTYKFVAPTNGYYAVFPRVVVTPTEGGTLFRCPTVVSTSADVLVSLSIVYQYSLSTDSIVLGVPLLFYMGATNYLQVGINHDNTVSQVVEGGSDLTSLKIYKIS